MHLEEYDGDTYFTLAGRRYLEIDPGLDLRDLLREPYATADGAYPTLLTRKWPDRAAHVEDFLWVTQQCDCRPVGEVL